jgi:hypothetical protein
MRGVRIFVGMENITEWSLPVYGEAILKERKTLKVKLICWKVAVKEISVMRASYMPSISSVLTARASPEPHLQSGSAATSHFFSGRRTWAHIFPQLSDRAVLHMICI